MGGGVFFSYSPLPYGEGKTTNQTSPGASVVRTVEVKPPGREGGGSTSFFAVAARPEWWLEKWQKLFSFYSRTSVRVRPPSPLLGVARGVLRDFVSFFAVEEEGKGGGESDKRKKKYTRNKHKPV